MSREHLLTRQIEEYIGYKQGLGFKILVEAEELRRFAKFTRGVGHTGPLTTDVLMKWLTQNPAHTRWYKARRLETVINFAKYVVVFDPRTEMPPKGVFGRCHGRTTPRIVTEDEIKLIMEHAKRLVSPDGLRGLTTATAFGLLWSTGLRPSELCRLLMTDVDLREGLVHVRETKFCKERIVPLHESTRDALQEYAYARDALHPNDGKLHFFLSTRGAPLGLRQLEYAMQIVRPYLGEGSLPGRRCTPRLYDLRHSFACITIQRWMVAGEDINHKLLQLSTYLGHVKPSDTYWYLTGTPELFTLAGDRFEEYVDSFNRGDSHE